MFINDWESLFILYILSLEFDLLMIKVCAFIQKKKNKQTNKKIKEKNKERKDRKKKRNESSMRPFPSWIIVDMYYRE